MSHTGGTSTGSFLGCTFANNQIVRPHETARSVMDPPIISVCLHLCDGVCAYYCRRPINSTLALQSVSTRCDCESRMNPALY